MNTAISRVTHLGRPASNDGIMEMLRTVRCCGTPVLRIPPGHDFTTVSVEATCAGHRVPYYVLPDGTDVLQCGLPGGIQVPQRLQERVTMGELYRVFLSIPNGLPGRSRYGAVSFRPLGLAPLLPDRFVLTLERGHPLEDHVSLSSADRDFYDVYYEFSGRRDCPVSVRQGGERECLLSRDMMYRVLYQIAEWSRCVEGSLVSTVPFEEGFPDFLRWIDAYDVYFGDQ